MLRIILLFALVAPAAAAVPIDSTRLLWAIRQVESGDRWDRRGAAGELGAYQFTAARWHELAPDLAFDSARNPSAGDLVARRALARIVAELERRRQPVTVRNISRGWNPRAPPDYADRLGNLYASR